MTIKNNILGGTDWVKGDGVEAEDLNDTFDATIQQGSWSDLVYTTDTIDNYGILAFSSSRWQVQSNITTDSGANWSAGGFSGAGTLRQISVLCKADSTKAISCQPGASNAGYTDDSGATWSDSSTDPANVTTIKDGSFPTTGVAILVGQASSGNNIWRSTDGGDTWSQVTSGPSGAGTDDVMWSVDMYSGTHGIAIAADGSVWSTTDGGVNWTDSTYNIGTTTGEGSYVKAISNTGYICIYGATKGNTSTLTTGIYKGTTAANGTLKLLIDQEGAFITNFCESNSGNIYFVMDSNLSDGNDYDINLTKIYRTADNGDTWSVRLVSSNTAVKDTASIPTYGEQLVEYDTNKLLLKYKQGNIVKIVVN